jgi:hypothetical protein
MIGGKFVFSSLLLAVSECTSLNKSLNWRSYTSKTRTLKEFDGLQDTGKTAGCNYLFSFRFMEFECNARKSLNLVGCDVENIGCPYLYPYQHIIVNKNLQTTRLSERNDHINYFFGTLSLPLEIIAKNIKTQVKLHFANDFDIMNNANETLDILQEVDEVDTLLLEWEADFGSDGALAQRGDFACVPADGSTEAYPSAILSAVPKPASPCPWSGYTPGFWNTQTHTFLPSHCAYPAPTAWSRPAAQRAPVWVHLLGDSNMNILYGHLCGAIGYRAKYRGERFPGNVIWSACVSADGALAVVHSISWMTSGPPGRFALGLQFRPATVGQTMASFLCRQDTLPGPPADPADCARWNVTAERTVALSGSHSPDLLVPRAAAAVRGWLDEIAARLPRPGSLAVALVGGVCIRHVRGRPVARARPHQRNNYRLRAVNDAALAAARERGLPALDFFSVTLAAGCGPESKADGVHFQAPVYRSESAAFFAWISGAAAHGAAAAGGR